MASPYVVRIPIAGNSEMEFRIDPDGRDQALEILSAISPDLRETVDEALRELTSRA